MKTIKCYKCNGEGRIEAFKHVENGICFECGGRGMLDVEDTYIDISEYRMESIKKINELDKRYKDAKENSCWCKKWQYKWSSAQFESDVAKERFEILNDFDAYVLDFKRIIKESIENDLDTFEEIKKLDKKYNLI